VQTPVLPRDSAHRSQTATSGPVGFRRWPNARVDESLPYGGPSVTISVSYGQLDAKFSDVWREDGTFSSG
jgi:hypothetical protein